MPEVSVLIATYQRRALLQRAIDSVYKQDFDDYELVVVDDCSPDDTSELM
ncbi:MAG: glycosyltransferase family 2 protein, partial [Woeseiales bacterium]